MSLKIAAEYSALVAEDKPVIVIREYDEERDKAAVEVLERRCEVVQKGKPSIVTDLLGDPIGRVRNLTLHVMLVAECVEEKMIVGAIRGSIRRATRGKKDSQGFPIYVNLGYILGLRVSPTHRRLGVATKLVQQLEEWCKQNGAEYAYMATDCSNEASINLFTQKCNYIKFRTPKVLVQPVHIHKKPIKSDIAIIQLPPQLAQNYYLQIFQNSECFPKDIDNILNNKLNLGTFMAIDKKQLPNWDIKSGNLPSSFAILSIWNTKEVFKLQVKGVSRLRSAFCLVKRVLDFGMPCLKVPSVTNVFKGFGFYFLYGVHMEGENGHRLMKSLCAFAHNLGTSDGGCGFLVAEVGNGDNVSEAIPHWTKFSWDEDIWCIKKLEETDDKSGDQVCDWIKSPRSSQVIFVDPRDF